MPFVGDRDHRLQDFTGRWRDGDATVEARVTWGGGEHDTLFVADVGGVIHGVDEEIDLLELAPAGAVVTLERGPVTLKLWRRDGKVWASAEALVDGALRSGPAAVGIEAALLALGDLDPTRAVPPVCFFCTHSDYEPSTGFGCGHLACFVEDAEAYHRIAVSPSSRERKWGMWRDDLRFSWVDEMHTCPRWARRPRDHGYRG